jgi:sec-independent protein translocase protein TatB
MFDIGFWELVLVGLVSLLVFGPERLPRVAREASLWIRKARSMVASVKAEIDQELELHELKQSLLDEKKKLEREALSARHRLDPISSDQPTSTEAKLETSRREHLDEQD